MGNLFRKLFEDYGVWIIAAYALSQIISGIKDQKIGKAIWGLCVAGFAYYFGTNPQKVLAFVGELFGQLFGG